MTENAELVLKALIEEDKGDGITDFTEVTPESLKMKDDDFYKALKELEKRGKVKGIRQGEDGKCMYDDIEIETEEFKHYK